LSEAFPDFTFAPVGAVSIPSLSGPKRPTLAKAAARNFRLSGFDSLVSSTALPDSAFAPSDPHVMAGPEFPHTLPEQAFVRNQYLVQPLPSNLINDPSPSLSPDDQGGMANSSTLQQFIITRTPPAENEWAATNPEAVLETEGGQDMSQPVVDASGAVPSAVASQVDGEITSGTEWIINIIPQIGKSTINQRGVVVQ
jgi:hypothetical protein